MAEEEWEKPWAMQKAPVTVTPHLPLRVDSILEFACNIQSRTRHMSINLCIINIYFVQQFAYLVETSLAVSMVVVLIIL